jgi:putative N6-adenine-specific DNA methylase
MTLDLVATCALGLEELLQAELSELGAEGIVREKGAVRFQGGWPEVWRANWRLRTANRVLVRLATWNGHDGDALAAGARNLVRRRGKSWDGVDAGRLFHPRRTFAVKATARVSRIRDTRWVALSVKDGLVDGQRDRWGRRADVSRADPDLSLRVFLVKDQATLLLDTSGEPLDRRGYRLEAGEAPLRETLAAACVLASGWDGRGPVADPLCGSGTLLAEAALVALGRPPGQVRRRLGGGWAFEALPGFDAEVFARIRGETPAAPGPEVRLWGVDRDGEVLGAARANLERAGLLERSELTLGDGFAAAPPPVPGLVAVNPPYGERLAGEREQWQRLGDLLKQRYTGWRAVVLAGDEGRGKWIGLRPRRRLPVRNGPLSARILVFDLY